MNSALTDDQAMIALLDAALPKKRGPGRPKDEAAAQKAAAAETRKLKAEAAAEARKLKAEAAAEAKAQKAAAAAEAKAQKAEEREALKAAKKAASSASSIVSAKRGPGRPKAAKGSDSDRDMIDSLRQQIVQLQGQLAAVKAIVC